METVGGKGRTEERVIRKERDSEGGGKEAGRREKRGEGRRDKWPSRQEDE